MPHRLDWIRNAIVRRLGRSVAWICGGYTVWNILLDLFGLISGDTQNTIAKALVNMVESYYTIPVIGTAAAISTFLSAAMAFFIIILLWITREPKAGNNSKKDNLRATGSWVPWKPRTSTVGLSEAIKNILPPRQKLDQTTGPEIIAKRKESARIFRELAEKLWAGIDILKDKRRGVKKLFQEVNRDVQKIAGKRDVHGWEDLDKSLGTIDTVRPEKIDEWIRDHRDWLLKTATEYDRQAAMMETTGEVY